MHTLEHSIETITAELVKEHGVLGLEKALRAMARVAQQKKIDAKVNENGFEDVWAEAEKRLREFRIYG
jgi:hypothetical protein